MRVYVCRIVWSVLERPLEKAVTFAKGTGVRFCLPMAPHCVSVKLPPSDLKPSSLLHKGHLYRYPSAIPLFSSTILLFTQDSLPFRDRINSWFCLLRFYVRAAFKWDSKQCFCQDISSCIARLLTKITRFLWQTVNMIVSCGWIWQDPQSHFLFFQGSALE